MQEVGTGTTFPDWTTQFPQLAAAGMAGVSDDYDGDGYANGIEFYLGLDPTRDSNTTASDPNAERRPNLIRVPGGLALEFTPASGLLDKAIQVKGQTSYGGLENWEDVPVGDSPVAGRKRISLPYASNSQGFARLVVRIPE